MVLPAGRELRCWAGRPVWGRRPVPGLTLCGRPWFMFGRCGLALGRRSVLPGLPVGRFGRCFGFSGSTDCFPGCCGRWSGRQVAPGFPTFGRFGLPVFGRDGRPIPGRPGFSGRDGPTGVK